MKLCYQVATPDVAIADSVTAYQGPLEQSLKELASLGYDGVEFMTLDPDQLDWEAVKALLEKYNLAVALVCTGEVYGQLKISFTDPSLEVRKKAVERTKRIIDFAAYLGANVNFGRIRGQYYSNIEKSVTWNWAVDAFRELSDYARPKNVKLALETISVVYTNFINTMEDAKKMVLDVDRDNFRLMMDTFQMNLEERDLIKAIKDYSEWNIHVHLSDNNRQYPGQCALDFEKILKAFHEKGYDGAFSTEILQIPSMREAAAESVSYLSPILKEIYG